MMEAVSISETSVSFYETTQRNIPEDSCFILAAVRTWNLIQFCCLFKSLQRLEEQFAQQFEEQEQVFGPSLPLPADLPDLSVHNHAHHIGSTRSSLSSVSEGWWRIWPATCHLHTMASPLALAYIKWHASWCMKAHLYRGNPSLWESDPSSQ
jgi:hypothetical protein